jgi:hypothetical protein
MMFLLDPKDTRVILIGASTFEDKNLPPLPAIKDNNVKLRALLGDVVGISKDDVHILEDRDYANQITLEISKIASKGLDIIYYAGHGLPHLKQLYLATKKTESDDPEISGALLAEHLIRIILKKSKAKRIIFIFDCCHSGLARENIDTKSKDVFLLTATSSVETAKSEAPENKNYTAFTHELLVILEQGIESAGKILTLDDIFNCLKKRLEGKKLPKPESSSHKSSPNKLGICKNQAYQEPSLTQDKIGFKSIELNDARIFSQSSAILNPFNVIYVPTINIQDEAWLISNYFLWERLYRIVPEGVAPKQTQLEKQLVLHDQTFIRRAPFEPYIEQSVLVYQNIVEEIFSNRENQKIYDNMLKKWKSPTVSVFSQKTNQELIEIWNDYEITQRKNRQGYIIPQFWADLWLIVLAWQTGKYDGLGLVSDQPLAKELIRLINLFDFETSKSHTLLNPQLKSIFFTVGLPTFKIVKTQNANVNISEWRTLKQQFKELREDYHTWLAEKINEIPVFMERQRPLDQLVEELRQEFGNEFFTENWKQRFKRNGLWLMPWMITAWFQFVAVPNKVTAIASLFGTLVAMKFTADVFSSTHLPEPFLYEYEIQRHIKTSV